MLRVSLDVGVVAGVDVDPAGTPAEGKGVLAR